jgi:hypothetical protein
MNHRGDNYPGSGGRYRGKISYGAHRKTYRGGTQTRVRQAHYHQVDAPRLRIIDEAL